MYPEQQEAAPAAEVHLAPRPARNGSATKATRSPARGIAFKFGGSSLLGADRMLHAAALVRDAAVTRPVTVVVSAMKGVTNRLLEIAGKLERKEFAKAREAAESVLALHFDVLDGLQLPERDHAQVWHELKLLGRDLLHETPQHGPVVVDPALYDRLASFGERFGARLFAAALNKLGSVAVPVASSDFVLTCDTFQHAIPHLAHTRQRGREVLMPLLQSRIVPVVTGFIGATIDGRITTMGRNSSDFSGALVAYVVNAEELVIWTDVDGIFTACPRETAEAKLLHELSYDEAHALAASGAKVLHPRVLPLAAEHEMTVWVRNTFKPHLRGTRIGPAQNGGAA
jgi:bifunctional aspartokinase / homoserine dehydrogenase 1